MKLTPIVSALLASALLNVSGWAADAAKNYQVTGQIVEITDTSIVVQKNDEKWELARKKSTKGAASLKVGDKVTIYYHMVADEVLAKPAGKTGKSGKADKTTDKNAAKQSSAARTSSGG